MRRGFDHLVLCVSDLDAAASWYERCGFTTTPRARHDWGTDNRLVQLDGCFLEILTVGRPALIPPHGERSFSFGAHNQAYLARREGMSMLVFETADAAADRAEFAERGLPDVDDFYFERKATLPDGEQVIVAFSLAFATDPRLTDAAFFCCQQHAPQYFWKPEFQRHANGAIGIDEVVMAAAEPDDWHEFFARIQEPDSVTAAAGSLEVRTPRGTLRVLSPETLRKRYPDTELPEIDEGPVFVGFTVRVGSANDTAARLDANGIPHARDGRTLRIAPAAAYGCALELREG